MRIPFWQSEQAHPTKAIDRLQSSRSFRRIMGLAVTGNFEAVVGAIVLVRGTGKHVRLKELGSVEVEFEDSAREVFLDLMGNQNPSESDIQFASAELACYQTNCCKTLLNQTGVNKNDLVAIGVTDPGVSYLDFDGNEQYRSLVNSAELAKQTGITIVDRFRERDRVDGGNGQNLFALAYWFLLADRDPRIAEENRLLVWRNELGPVAYYLPASDGLDAVLPAIQVRQFSRDESTRDASTCAAWIDELVQWGRAIDANLKLRVILDESIKVPEWSTDECAISGLEEFEVSGSAITAVASAFLANAFVDQLPVSIPDLTGNQTPRILGSLTPGSLVNFRNFVLETSKVTPSIMKLRDAV